MAYDSRTALSGDMTPEDTPDPPILAKGHYYGTIRRYEIRENVQYKDRSGADKEATLVDFHISVTRPGADVDPGKLDGVDLAAFQFTKSFWYTPIGMAELRDFIKKFHFPPGRTYNMLYPETLGREVLISLEPGSFKSRRTGQEVPTMNLTTIVPADAEPVTDLSAAEVEFRAR